MSPTYTITHNTVTVHVNGQVLTVNRGARNFDAARTAVLNEQWDDIESIFTPGHAIERWLHGKFSLQDGHIVYDGGRIDPRLSTRMLRMATEGASPIALMRFWDRLQYNPSMRSVEQLYAFLELRGIPIDDEGHILAYKAVNPDWTDVYTGKISNIVGSEHVMPRNRVSDDPQSSCSYGFHCGSLEYARDFRPPEGHIVIVRVPPEDVVCIPYDCSQQKMRMHRYRVLREHDGSTHMSSTYEATLPAPVPVQAAPAAPAPPPDPGAALDREDLRAMTLAALRTLARQRGIKRANNIPGGKDALIDVILDRDATP